MAAIIKTPTATYRAIGATDDCTTCDKCGKPHLKKTIILAILDADGNTEDVVYYGSTCATRATGIRKTTLDRAVAAANNQRRIDLETLATWKEYYDGGEAGIDRFIHNNPHCLHRYATRTAVFLDIARTVAELEAAVRIPTRP